MALETRLYHQSPNGATTTEIDDVMQITSRVLRCGPRTATPMTAQATIIAAVIQAAVLTPLLGCA